MAQRPVMKNLATRVSPLWTWPFQDLLGGAGSLVLPGPLVKLSVLCRKNNFPGVFLGASQNLQSRVSCLILTVPPRLVYRASCGYCHGHPAPLPDEVLKTQKWGDLH